MIYIFNYSAAEMMLQFYVVRLEMRLSSVIVINQEIEARRTFPL